MDIETKVKIRLRKDAAKLQKTIPLFADQYAISVEETRATVLRNAQLKSDFPARFAAREAVFSNRMLLLISIYLHISNALDGPVYSDYIYRAAIASYRHGLSYIADILCTECAERLNLLPLIVHQFADHSIRN